jgi:hypothetical protein
MVYARQRVVPSSILVNTNIGRNGNFYGTQTDDKWLSKKRRAVQYACGTTPGTMPGAGAGL